MISLLCLNKIEVFNNVFHSKLFHNFRKRRILKYIINWVLSFLTKRRAFIIINGRRSKIRTVHVDISQSLSVSLIFYFFFNVDLIDQCVRFKLKTNVIKFVNDVNILTYSKSTENNCKTFSKLHDVCKK